MRSHIRRRFTDSFTDSGHSALRILFSFRRLPMEARVGIGQHLHLYQTSPKPFGSGYFSKCCADKEINSTGGMNQPNNYQLSSANIQHMPTLLVPVLVPAILVEVKTDFRDIQSSPRRKLGRLPACYFVRERNLVA